MKRNVYLSSLASIYQSMTPCVIFGSLAKDN